MFKGFKDFIFRGNVLDLAIGVIIGVAFNNVVTALVKDLITPLFGIFGGSPDFSAIYFTINNSKFMIGDFINAAISFIIVSGVLYFGIVSPIGKFKNKFKEDRVKEVVEKNCPECLSTVPIRARKCKYCSSQLQD